MSIIRAEQLSNQAGSQFVDVQDLIDSIGAFASFVNSVGQPNGLATLDSNGFLEQTLEGALISPSSTTDGEVVVYDGAGSVKNSPLNVDSSGNFYGHGAKVKEITGTTYTIQESDTGKILHFTNVGGCVVTCPGTSLTYASNIQTILVDIGGGGVTVSDDGVDSVVKSSGNLFSSAQQNAHLSLYRYSATEWMLGGETA